MEGPCSFWKGVGTPKGSAMGPPIGTQRYKLVVSFSGSSYIGWQHQPKAHGKSAQQTLQKAIEGFWNHPVSVVGCSRTDSGVHALNFVAHVDLQKKPDNQGVLQPPAPGVVYQGINWHLTQANEPMVVKSVELADDKFHARHSTKLKTYVYRLLTQEPNYALKGGRGPHFPHLGDKVWWYPRELNPRLMHQATRIFVGTHNFASFRSAKCQAVSPIRDVNVFDLVKQDNPFELTAMPHLHLFHFVVTARAFLHSQVRCMVGAVVAVGAGQITLGGLKKIMAEKDENAKKFVAPAEGLYLAEVEYESNNNQPSVLEEELE